MEWVIQQLVDAGKDVTGMHAVSGGAQAGTASMVKCVWPSQTGYSLTYRLKDGGRVLVYLV